MRIAPFVLSAALASAASWAQSSDAGLTFEVASIKPSPPPNGGMRRVGCPSDPGRITCTNMTLANLVGMAYGLNSYQLSGLSYGSPEMYELAIKIPEGATKDQIKIMWQNLLKERFKLTVHWETKDWPTYELTVAKGGIKFQESAPPPPPPSDGGAAPRPDAPRPGPPKLAADGYPDVAPGGMAMMGGVARWRPARITMDQFASMLGSQLGTPVTNSTGLTGKYDLNLFWATGGGRRAAAAASSDSPLAGVEDTEQGPTLTAAVQSQLGLKLDQKKGSIQMLVVDHYEKPTEN